MRISTAARPMLRGTYGAYPFNSHRVARPCRMSLGVSAVHSIESLTSCTSPKGEVTVTRHDVLI